MAIELTSPILIHPYTDYPASEECDNGNLVIGSEGTVWYNDNGTMKKEEIELNISESDILVISGIISSSYCETGQRRSITGIDNISVGKYITYSLDTLSNVNKLYITSYIKYEDGSYVIIGNKVGDITTVQLAITYNTGPYIMTPYSVCVYNL